MSASLRETTSSAKLTHDLGTVDCHCRMLPRTWATARWM